MDLNRNVSRRGPFLLRPFQRKRLQHPRWRHFLPPLATRNHLMLSDTSNVADESRASCTPMPPANISLKFVSDAGFKSTQPAVGRIGLGALGPEQGDFNAFELD